MTLDDNDKLEAMLRAPKDSQWYANARYYKKGVHGRYFVWSNGEYRATTADPLRLISCIEVLG